MSAFEGTNTGLAWDAGLNADDMKVSFGQYMGAALSDAWGYNPTVALSRAAKVQDTQMEGSDAVDWDAISDAVEIGQEQIAPLRRREGMSVDDQKAWIENEGLTEHLTPQEGYNEDTLRLVADAKHRELENALVREKAPAWMGVPGFFASLGTSFIDPLNLAAGFFPVVGQARQIKMLQQTSGYWGRAGVRAGVGLIEGAAGATMVEPLIQIGRSAEQADWEMSQSLINIAFGSIMGATMHVAKGALGEWKFEQSRRKNPVLRQPWEMTAATDRTEALRMEHSRAILDAAEEAGADITRENAEAAATLFDARARAWAYDTGKSVEEYYKANRPDWRAEIAKRAQESERGIQTELEGIAAEDAKAAEASASAEIKPAPHPEAEVTAEGSVTPSAQRGRYTAENGKVRFRGEDAFIINGQEREQAHYELRELSDVIASHDPEAQFAKRADYPENVQERPYHSDAGEQQKVLRNAATLEPAYLVNNNPDAVNGPPIITEDGVVLGGNSRAMSIQLAYAGHPERAEGYRNSLRKLGPMFGIDSAAVDGFERPVLVRVVEGGKDVQEMAVKSRLYNQSQTQGLQAKAEGVSRGRMISKETLDVLAAGMEDFDTLREFMASPKSKDFVQALYNDGVIEQTQLARLTDASGKLNDAGKELAENALRGYIVQDYDVLAACPPEVLNKLDRSLPALARLKARREGWDMSGVVTRALKLITKAQKEGVYLETMLAQGSLVGESPKAGVIAVALTMKNATQKEVQLRFLAMADAAEKTHRGQSVMMLAQSNGDTPAKAFIRSFMKPIASVDGEPVPAFNPSGNARHAAIQYVYENGGKGRSVSVAEEALQKTIASRKTPKEAKAEARTMLGELSQLDGSVAIYEPQLGPYFRYKQGEELWQSPAHRESSIAAVRKQYEGTDKWMMAPNGKATNLSEQQWLIVRTPEFKRWFGDWEADPANASKVVDANGEPLVVFHGSPEKNIEVFANHSQLEGHESGHRSTGDAGIYTSPRRSYAERYTAADLASDESSGGRVYELYLNIRRPATLAEAGLSHPDKITAEKAAELREQGYDGIMYEHRKRPEYIVLDPRQIKSTENRGSFDPENPNSLYQGKAREGASQRVVSEEMYPVTQNEKPLQTEASLDDVYVKAAANKDVFQNGVRSIAEATGGKALLRPGDGLKTRERALEKISRDYGNAPGAHNRVVDVLGGTVLYHTRDDVKTALPEILRGIEAMGGTVIRIKDRFHSPVSGYKDLLINIRMKDGLVTELLVTTEKLAEAKNGIGHKLYEITQAIAEYVPEATPEERKILFEAKEQIETASELYYGSTGNQSNATASASVIRKPLYGTSAILEDISSSSIYPRLSSLLETIWKNPSLEETKGMSSYSQNRGLVRESTEISGASGKNRSAMEGTSFEGEAALPRKEIIPENEAQGKSVSNFSDVSAEDRAFMEQRAVEGDGFEDARAKVTFDATEDGRAVIEFFKAADASSAPHELYHIFRREMEKTANTEGVSERAREMWRQVCDFVGAKEGEKWTVEMEEKFARAGERFLMEGKAPLPSLQSVFEKMKQWFTDIYQNADEAGLEISDGMRKIFGEMLTPSPEEADAMFRYHMGKLLQSDPSEGMDTRLELPEDTGDARKVLSDAQADAQGRVEKQLEGFADRLPEEDIAAFREEYDEAMRLEDEAIAGAERRGEMLKEAAACELGGI